MHIEKLPDRCRRNVSSLFCYESSSVVFFFFLLVQIQRLGRLRAKKYLLLKLV